MAQLLSARPRAAAIFRSRSTAAAGAQRLASNWHIDETTGLVSLDSADRYQTIIGLEIHAQLNVPTKLFSTAASGMITGHNRAPNKDIHPFDLAVPGFLPVLSRAAVQSAILAAESVNCEIQNVSRFERKHYAYADLPSSYQITQQRWPIAKDGYISFNLQGGQKKKKRSKERIQWLRCRVDRIQLEQDTGKTSIVNRMDDSGQTRTTYSRVDFNRAGCALIEMVLKPDLRSSRQAAAVFKQVHQLWKHIGICDGRMEEGHLRCDLNVNLEDLISGKRSPRVEVKNLNSIKHVQDAATYEAKRQAQLLEEGRNGGFPSLVHEETRTWDVTKHATRLIRYKDGEQDYRFLPEPDLPPLVLDQGEALGGFTLERFLEENLVELPSAAIQRLVDSYGISEDQATVIAGDSPAIQFFDAAVRCACNQTSAQKTEVAKVANNLLCNELFALVKEDAEDIDNASVENSNVTEEQFGKLVVLVLEEIVSSTMAKKLLKILYEECNGGCPRQVAKERGFQLITDKQELDALCRSVIRDHPEELQVYQRGGKFINKMLKLFTGKAMLASRGNAHPERLRESLEEVLQEVSRGV